MGLRNDLRRPADLRLRLSPGDKLGGMTTALLAVAAADWVSGGYLLVTAWQRRRVRARKPLADRLAPFGPTPLADEVEEWLSRGRPEP
jgi:hypothetical protein